MQSLISRGRLAGLSCQRPAPSTQRGVSACHHSPLAPPVQRQLQTKAPQSSRTYSGAHASRPLQRPERLRCSGLQSLQPGSTVPEPAQTDSIPADIRLEAVSDSDQSQVEYDEENKVVRIPLSAIGDDTRRRKLVMFTCNRCGGRSARLVNPVAWEKGLVFGQCQHCEVWHTLANNNPRILEEIRYDREDDDTGSKASDQTVMNTAGVDDDVTSDAAGVLGQQSD